MPRPKKPASVVEMDAKPVRQMPSAAADEQPWKTSSAFCGVGRAQTA